MDYVHVYARTVVPGSFCQKNQFCVNFYPGFKLSDYIGGTVIFITWVKICSTKLNFLKSSGS